MFNYFNAAHLLVLALTDGGMVSCRFRSTFLSSYKTFDTSCAARIPTAPAINYTACWQLVFIHIRLFIIYLALLSRHCQSAPTYPRSTNLFCFFERGQS